MTRIQDFEVGETDQKDLRRELAGIVVVIPAWQPEMRLESLVRDLLQAGVERLVVVDDGSTQASAPVFESIAALPEVSLCRHDTNRGKGRALKTAFAYALTTPLLRGVVTADGDGQHLAADVLAVARQLVLGGGRPVLGVRKFSGQGVPFRSRFGNLLTQKIFTGLTGQRVSDTQTGLRALPAGLLPALLFLPGERYEYETAMLAYLCQQKHGLLELPIQTVYLEGNRASHFRPFQDSLRIYFALFQTLAGRWRQPRPKSNPARRTLGRV